MGKEAERCFAMRCETSTVYHSVIVSDDTCGNHRFEIRLSRGALSSNSNCALLSLYPIAVNCAAVSYYACNHLIASLRQGGINASFGQQRHLDRNSWEQSIAMSHKRSAWPVLRLELSAPNSP
jgi:hypothetical protein